MTSGDTPDPEGERTRRNDRRLARWAIAGVVVAALIGAGAGLGGAVLGSRLNSNSAKTEDRTNFLRSQRESAYAELASDSIRCEDELNVWSETLSADVGAKKPAPALPADADSCLQEASSADVDIDILATGSPVSTADTLWGDLNQMLMDLDLVQATSGRLVVDPAHVMNLAQVDSTKL